MTEKADYSPATGDRVRVTDGVDPAVFRGKVGTVARAAGLVVEGGWWVTLDEPIDSSHGPKREWVFDAKELTPISKPSDGNG